MTSQDLIEEIRALAGTPPSPEGDTLPEYALVFEEGYLEGVSRSLEIIMKYANEIQNETEKESHTMSQPDPCATCRIRDHWCCDPWETRDEHEGDDHD